MFSSANSEPPVVSWTDSHQLTAAPATATPLPLKSRAVSQLLDGDPTIAAPTVTASPFEHTLRVTRRCSGWTSVHPQSPVNSQSERHILALRRAPRTELGGSDG